MTEREDDHQPVPELTAEDVARRQRANRRAGRIIAVVCLLVALMAAAVMLTINRGTADQGAPSPVEVASQ